ncbi:hypothetical protein EJH27_01640 [Salmonella enterica subsp. enterica serovar Virchow]|nr:hypothetical protein [Salmonella enterica subsp. enterica serovar Virchow]
MPAQQLESLGEALAAARRVTATRRAALEKAEARYDAARDDEADAQYRYDCALAAAWGDTPDWFTLLDGSENRSVVMYDLACRELEKMGLSTLMVNLETGQRVVWLGFETDTEDELQQKLRGVQFILPFVKAGRDGQREISLRHARPEAFALSLAVDQQTQAVSVVVKVWGREKSSTGFPGLEAALRFIRGEYSDIARGLTEADTGRSSLPAQ